MEDKFIRIWFMLSVSTLSW